MCAVVWKEGENKNGVTRYMATVTFELVLEDCSIAALSVCMCVHVRTWYCGEGG